MLNLTIVVKLVLLYIIYILINIYIIYSKFSISHFYDLPRKLCSVLCAHVPKKLYVCILYPFRCLLNLAHLWLPSSFFGVLAGVGMQQISIYAAFLVYVAARVLLVSAPKPREE